MRPARHINGNNRDQKATILAYVDPSNKTGKECPGTGCSIRFVVVEGDTSIGSLILDWALVT